ncbi:hypothetical protein BDY17DRAFT_320945 [Neohortaea acidophila]|uniref:Extracellular membrane protein CFEM domain-containing protein n=1 Tax=Neohortaea acidophila TaxID=245834 RepID=A0A6A6Q2B1_9PEZI|nr:uncharacterized protein BDY17DRAFT_320945 [Neohortaea acidophila]KAF2486129.1 hypothetical protein BDY17DRAFT_320945 [Neohortaea acidophila]
MRITLRKAALLSLPVLASAVSLSDLAPRAQNLPPACNKVYNEQIPGCTASDFSSHDCSRSCILGLYALVDPIRNACGNRGITGENLIVAFLADIGPQQICVNAPTGTSLPPQTTAWPPPPHMGPGSSAWPSQTEPWGSTVTAGISTASSLPPSDTSSLVVDTSSAPTIRAWTSPTTTSAKTPTATSSTASPQTNFGDHSGGGSPFDASGNLGGAGSISLSIAVALLSTAVALFTTFR